MMKTSFDWNFTERKYDSKYLGKIQDAMMSNKERLNRRKIALQQILANSEEAEYEEIKD